MVCNLFDNNNETCHFLYNNCQILLKLIFGWNYDNMLHCYTAKALYQAMP